MNKLAREELIAKIQTQGIEPEHASQMVDGASREAVKQVIFDYYNDRQVVFCMNLKTGRFEPIFQSDLADPDAQLESLQGERTLELLNIAIAKESRRSEP